VVKTKLRFCEANQEVNCREALISKAGVAVVPTACGKLLEEAAVDCGVRSLFGINDIVQSLSVGGSWSHVMSHLN